MLFERQDLVTNGTKAANRWRRGNIDMIELHRFRERMMVMTFFFGACGKHCFIIIPTRIHAFRVTKHMSNEDIPNFLAVVFTFYTKIALPLAFSLENATLMIV